MQPAPPRPRRRSRPRLATTVLLLAVAALVHPAPAVALVPGSTLVGCDQAANRVTVTASVHLDPSCHYTGGFDVTASDVELDCAGAVVDGTGQGGVGIKVVTPADTPLHGVTIRNCHVQGFLNGIRITRSGFRDLQPGHEYDNGLTDVQVLDSTVADTRGVGIFVDAFVTRATLQRLHISGAGSTGIYLEAGSADNVVADNEIVDNGFRENSPDGQLITVGGVQVRFWGTGREGLAIDGSRRNVVTGNHLAGNAAGGIYLYKNCGEYVHQKPGQWWTRRYGADDNTIEHNTIDGGWVGVWVAARQAQNTYPMDCSDPAYIDEPLRQVRLDVAAGNTVRHNTIRDAGYAVRVEDDRTTVEANTITAAGGDHWGVVVGTGPRTEVLGRPVASPSIVGNDVRITGNPSPYRWVDGVVDATFTANTTDGSVATWCQAPSVPLNPFVMTLAFAVEPVGSPPTPTPPLDYPVLAAQPPCPSATTGGGSPGTTATPGATTASVTPVVVTPRFTG